MLTILNLHNQSGISARALHPLVANKACFAAWFRQKAEDLKLDVDYFKLEGKKKGVGIDKYYLGDFFLPLHHALSFAQRTRTPKAAQVISFLEKAVTKAPAPTQEPVPTPTTEPSEADSIVQMALAIQELTNQETKLKEIHENLGIQLLEVQLQLFDAKMELRGKLG